MHIYHMYNAYYKVKFNLIAAIFTCTINKDVLLMLLFVVNEHNDHTTV